MARSIYGTKQGGNTWNQKMRSVLEAIGYTQSYSDASIYIYFKDNVRIILPVFIQITLGDDSQCTVIIVYLTNTDLGDDSQCTRGKGVQLQIKYLSR